MCPNSVHKVTKMRNSSNMVLFTFFGSTLLDRVHIGPISLRVRRFISRPPSVFLVLRDILQLANSQFIGLGSVRRELLYRQKDGTGATSYVSFIRSSAESAGPKTSATSHSLVGGGYAVRLANRFALLSDDSAESSERCNGNPPASTKVTHVVDVHALPVSPKPSKGLTKRHHVSTESIDLAQPKQSKISPGAHDCETSRDRSVMVAPIVSVQPFENTLCLRKGFL
ncbi:hypothetical protein E2C01_059410 [Portunus trituberculatus]|uniref:Uncharacterized protein n=1 Tax=Portunus trituberculatus TaxID=210409 RepID=A0A5B7H7H3_PORTR|nr:hypothetical protein [Portunus trituberculatus]